MTYKVLPYQDNLALFTDLYQLTMAQVYWAEGMADWEGAFHYFYRTAPHGGGYSIACGLELLVDYLANLSFGDEDIDYLSSIPGADGKPIFQTDFLASLQKLEFKCDVDAVPEGTVIFPNEPIVRVSGPLMAAQIVETAILNLCNYASAIATQASRICWAAGDLPVFDFSPRRAPGIDGSFTTTRSAYIGGFRGTSNVWAARHLGMPAQDVKGTMAHSLIMCFDSELDAFMAYARRLPNNCLFLVDTYGTPGGVRHAIEAGRQLRAGGHELLGIRLDSGDLAKLSLQARRMLDEAGFERAAIFASNDLNEFIIRSLRMQGAALTLLGVGTNLIVPPLDGVYKLSAIRKPGAGWEPKIKLSDQPAKISIPGVLQVKRFRAASKNVADVIYDEGAGITDGASMISLRDESRKLKLPPGGTIEGDLLVPVMRRGSVVYQLPTLSQIRDRCQAELSHLPAGTRRFENPDEYRVGVESSLYRLRHDMIVESRSSSDWGYEAS
jgi:nicotinate phosphoribosyltransferase